MSFPYGGRREVTGFSMDFLHLNNCEYLLSLVLSLSFRKAIRTLSIFREERINCCLRYILNLYKEIN
jgi:hypothetical protein